MDILGSVRQVVLPNRLLLRFVYGRRFGPHDLPSPGAVNAEFGELSAFLHPRPVACERQESLQHVADVYFNVDANNL